MKPAEIPYDVAQRLFSDAWKAFGKDNQRLPLTEPQFRRALSGENMVESAKPVGGPQKAEVTADARRAKRHGCKPTASGSRPRGLKLDEAAKKRDAGVAALRSGR